ncbi:hypothetical protein [Endozoicomonas sp. 8E]|uniref:hypothetical protein n=1 Tax=Endozoicomonas sp. 8E TaxID=3035692 RepID=UPI0029393232|nr:hypothetical protein [Endozoicomonas sp. 8E]WOG26589.1 hypothetical protein P6910_18860 [Endozoicomonas sp. 8E]
MLPWATNTTNTTSSNLSSWTVPGTNTSPPVFTTGLSKKTAGADGTSSGRSIHLRQITSTPGQRHEWVTHVHNALRNIDIPLGNRLLRELVKKAQQDFDRMSQNNRTDDERFYSPPLLKLINYLVCCPTLPENISVLQTLADLGLGLPEVSVNDKIPIPPQLLKQLLDNTDHEAVEGILGEHAKTMMFNADPGFMEILEHYLSPGQLRWAAREFLNYLARDCHFLVEINQLLRLSDGSAPYLIKAIFKSPGIRHGNPQASQDFYQTITTVMASEAFIFQLCLLEVNAQRHEKLILEGLEELDEGERERMLACAFILGQWELFKRLLSGSLAAILNQTFANGSNILHLMATAIPSLKSGRSICGYRCLNAYTPRYDKLFQYLPAETLANQRDNKGATPLLLLYHHQCAQLASAAMSGAEDRQLARARRSALIKLTASGHLIDCMQDHLDGKFPLNINWFFEFLQLYRSPPPSTYRAVSLRSTEYSLYEQLIHKPLPRARELLQPIINYFELHPDTLRNEQQTLELIKLMRQNGLPVEYSAQVLRFTTADMQKKLLGHLSATADDRNSLFIERRYDVSYDGKPYYYPWHLIGLGVGGRCAPDPDRFYCQGFRHAVAEFDRKHPKETVPQISRLWEAELVNCRRIKTYGRSLAFPSSEVPQGYRRFKFLKQQSGSTENWHDFVREQPQLDFFRTHKEKLGLESALLKPRGIYRLTDALDKLKACRLTEETLAAIALEPDGSALLQVFDDEKDTHLYHHYPYEAGRVDGLSVQASFDGLRLFARDAGRLWQHNFQAPDTLSSFHSAANERGWVPTPFFGSQCVPGTMGEWNVQDYPNIAPAPVGMRDWADIRSFSEQTFSSFGMRKLYCVTDCERQGELRITELGKAFYGLVINWLRVRHDTDNLDYKNSVQTNQLQEELVTIAADLFGSAYKMSTGTMKARISQEFPAESLRRAALECGYWCDSEIRYVQDIKSGRFPVELYPDHPNQSFDRERLNPDNENFTDRGFIRSSRAKGPNLGVNSGTLPLPHLDSLFWFALYTGWRLQEPSRRSASK